MKLLRMVREASIAVLVNNILKTTMRMNILKWINLWTRFLSMYRVKLGMLCNLLSQASSLIIYLNVSTACWAEVNRVLGFERVHVIIMIIKGKFQ